MKSICLTAIAVVIAACSTHQVRCGGGALRPINKPVASARPSGPGGVTSADKPAAPGKSAAALPETFGSPAVVPAEPRP
jgi:hypothetical protein